METFFKKELKDFSDEDLLSLAINPKSIGRKNLIEILDELKKRGYTEQVDNIESNLVKALQIYSKFWTRFAAYLIDGVILGLTGTINGLLFSDFFAQMGSQGLLVGFLISLLYFGLGNSKVFNGQTLGKKAMQLQVVNPDFRTLSVTKSIIRALIYTVPFFFLNYRIPGWSELSVSFIAKAVICFTFLIVLPFHLIINTPTRQALHDLFLGTYVINLEGFSRNQLGKSRLLPSLISGILAVFIMSLIVFINTRNTESRIIVQELRPLKEQIDKLDKVGYSSILSNTSSTRMLGSDEISRYKSLRLNIVLKENLISKLKPDDMEDLPIVKDAVRVILTDYPAVKNLDYIQVNLVYGFNIGISKSSKALTSSHSYDEWRQKIE